MSSCNRTDSRIQLQKCPDLLRSAIYGRTRSGGAQYKKEMSDREHELLLQQLLRHTGPVLLSGYHSDLYDTMLKDWEHIEFKTYAQSLKKKTEVIWMNFEISEEYGQMSFL